MANMSYGGGNVSSYYDLAKKGQIYVATAAITAMAAYSTSTATGGPLLWNGTGGTTTGVNNAQVDAVIIGVSWGITVASAAAVAIGLTGGNGQTSAPASPSTITAVTNTRLSVPAPVAAATGAGNQCSVYNYGNVSVAGLWFHPLFQTGTNAITALGTQPNYLDLAGMYIVPPNCWISVSASATATTNQIKMSLIWAEIPRQ